MISMTTPGYFSADDGAERLIERLVPAGTANKDHSASPFEYLGDCRREHQLEPQAEVTEHRGIAIKGWVIGANKTHITPLEFMDQIGEEAKLTPPEMVFGHNQLLFYHEPTGVCYNFLAVEALKGAHFSPPESDQAADIIAQQQLKVSVAKHNTNKEDVKELDISYDWTYTTDYKGTLQRIVSKGGDKQRVRTEDVRVEPTTERINIEKLKEREPILWFDDVNLFEDELHDHGISVMSIKVRVMPSGFYVLARYWMRLDHVVVRLHESRVHHLFGSEHLLREYTRKEESFDALFAQGHPRGMANYTNIDQFQHLLPVQEAVYEKIFLQ
ncbi:TPA: hypothetical protein N0F65_003608 [Lagenidium giganteum]|uniref:TIP41-like protein n=1 Tax=Lagenidium giganteum TaxID=4803 RepID=A0AAV2Z558_9STRA|nr:TPA: hypothetical protein N0F65_003608 [Lagenidium giganteum]